MDDRDGIAKLTDQVLKQAWPHTMDAMVWAEEFCKTYPSFDKQEAVAWFANAIMAGYDTAMMRKEAP